MEHDPREYEGDSRDVPEHGQPQEPVPSPNGPDSGHREVGSAHHEPGSVREHAPQGHLPQDDLPQGGLPLDRSGRDRSPQDRSGRDRSPQDGLPLDRSGRDRSPQDDLPLDRSGRDRSPQDGLPQDRLPQDRSSAPPRERQRMREAAPQRVPGTQPRPRPYEQSRIYRTPQRIAYGPAQGSTQPYPAQESMRSYPGQGLGTGRGPGRKQKQGPSWVALFTAMILTAALAISGTIGLLYATGNYDWRSPSGSPSQQSSQNAQQPEGEKTPVVKPENSQGTDWQAVATAVRPATVSIQVRTASAGDSGSGVLWDTTGNIVTNYHVVSNATRSDDAQLTVSLSDGRIFEAEVVGIDPTTDLAVIKISNPPSDLVAANFGDSENLAVGQSVMAVGSPLGLSDTVTTGIVSALDRPVAVKTALPPNADGLQNFQFPYLQNQTPQSETVVTNAIQVDASINPGNSGGPLFDESGHVIGINSSIASLGGDQSSSGSIGLGFAIPVNLVKNVATQLIETGKAQHAQLGVTINSAAVNVDGVTRLGAEVVSILPGGSAASADISVGDVIISIDGKEVVSASSLTGFVRRYNSGDVVKIKLARNGVAHEVEVPLKAK